MQNKNEAFLNFSTQTGASWLIRVLSSYGYAAQISGLDNFHMPAMTGNKNGNGRQQNQNSYERERKQINGNQI